MLIIFINSCLGFFCVVTWLSLYLFLLIPVKWLAAKVVSKVTYSVSSGMLNPTRSLSHFVLHQDAKSEGTLYTVAH